MPVRARALSAFVLGASLVLGGAFAALAEPVTLTPAQMRSAAQLSLQTGQTRQALDLAEALLRRDPGDVDALVLKSRALRDLGQYDPALETARRAYAQAETDAEIFAAAMVRAQALSSKGARTRAQLWLRMAAQYAPDQAARDVAEQDFLYLRKRNPWNTQLSFTLSPTSNVNNGSAHDRISAAGNQGTDQIEVEGISQALSGLSYSGALTTRYRFRQTDRSETEVGLHLFGQSYILSDDAKAQAPEASGSDFAYTSAAVGVVHRWNSGDWRMPVELSLLAGRAWYGQQDYSRYTHANIAKPIVLGKSTVLRLDAGAEHFRRVRDDATSRTYSANARLFHEFETGAHMRLHFGVSDTRSDEERLDRERLRGGIGYTLAEPIGPARITLEADFERSTYGDYPFVGIREVAPGLVLPVPQLTERTDMRGRIALRLWFEDLDYYGFSPTLTISHAETHSTIDLYDTVETGINVGFRSAF